MNYNMWNWFKQKEWWKQYEMSWKEKLHINFVNFFFHLTNKKGFGWLHLLVNMLCVLEINFRLYKNKELMDEVNVASIGYTEDIIPKGTLYCDGCLYKTFSIIARFFYGTQMDGFCYFLNRGDFTYGHPTDLLWDGCKCCGVGIEMDDDYDEDYSEYISQE